MDVFEVLRGMDKMTLDDWLNAAPADVPPDIIARIRTEFERRKPATNRIAIVKAVCESHGIPIDEVMGPSRYKSIVKCRRACCQELLRLGLSSVEVGRVMGRDHTSVLSLVKQHRRKDCYREETAAE